MPAFSWEIVYAIGALVLLAGLGWGCLPVQKT